MIFEKEIKLFIAVSNLLNLEEVNFIKKLELKLRIINYTMICIYTMICR